MNNFWSISKPVTLIDDESHQPRKGTSSSWERIFKSFAISFASTVLVVPLLFFVFAKIINPTEEASFDAVSNLVSIFFLLVLTVYWNIDSRFGRLWTYAATTFNDSAKIENKAGRSYLRACLASDLIDMNLWQHETFSSFFKTQLKEAIENHYLDSEQKDEWLHKVERQELRISEAHSLIYKNVEYWHHLHDSPTDTQLQTTTTSNQSAPTAIK